MVEKSVQSDTFYNHPEPLRFRVNLILVLFFFFFFQAHLNSKIKTYHIAICNFYVAPKSKLSRHTNCYVDDFLLFFFFFSSLVHPTRVYLSLSEKKKTLLWRNIRIYSTGKRFITVHTLNTGVLERKNRNTY